MIKNKIKKILVPLDGSKNSWRALDTAIMLARQCGATLTGIYVIYSPPRTEFRGIGSMPKGVKQDIEKIMESAKTRAAQNGIVFKSKIITGNVGYNIVKFSKDTEKFDLIIIGSRGHSSAKQMFFGSVSNYVIHAAVVPVMIVK